MSATDGRMVARDWSLLAVLSVLWGGSFFFNGVVLRELPPLTLVLTRVALAAAILLPVLYANRLPFPRAETATDWRKAPATGWQRRAPRASAPASAAAARAAPRH